MDTAQREVGKWWTRWRLTRNSSGSPGTKKAPDNKKAEAQVALWKAAWLRGANTVWLHQDHATNPYDADMHRAAWYAGTKWAREHPDRRTNRAPRFAHPRRRADDSKFPATLKRAVAISATSLTLYAISKVFRNRKRPGDAP